MENIIPMIAHIAILLFLVAILILQIVVLSGIKQLKNQAASMMSLQAMERKEVTSPPNKVLENTKAQISKNPKADGQVICPRCYGALPVGEKNCPHCQSPMSRRL